MPSLDLLNAIAAVFGVLMLLRNLPRAIAAVRARNAGGAYGLMAVVNVVLALAILVTAAVSHFGPGSSR